MIIEPSVIETIGRSTRAFDLPTKLLQDRIIYLGSEVTPETANSIIKQLLWLNADNPEAEIDFYINSPGGSVYDGMGIKDVIDSLQCKVNTLGTGLCASMGAYLLACGTGTRRATKNCRIMIHSVSSQAGGTVHNMQVDLEETVYLQEKMLKDLAGYSAGKTSYEEFKELTKLDKYLDPVQAEALGLIDGIV